MKMLKQDLNLMDKVWVMYNDCALRLHVEEIIEVKRLTYDAKDNVSEETFYDYKLTSHLTSDNQAVRINLSDGKKWYKSKTELTNSISTYFTVEEDEVLMPEKLALANSMLEGVKIPETLNKTDNHI